MATEVDDEKALSDGGSMLCLMSVSDSEASSEGGDTENVFSSDEDWFSEVGEDASQLDDKGWDSEDIPEQSRETLVATESVRPGLHAN